MKVMLLYRINIITYQLIYSTNISVSEIQAQLKHTGSLPSEAYISVGTRVVENI